MILQVTPDQAKELKAIIKREMSRRQGYGSMEKFSRDSYDFNSNPTPGGVITQDQGSKTINPLLNICDKGDLILVEVADPIPNSFEYEELLEFLQMLQNEKMTATSNPLNEENGGKIACRSACSGLCMMTCANTCHGCTNQCTNSCSGCGACTTGCKASCTSCGACTVGCNGCSGNCQGCAGGCQGECESICKNGCGTGCTGGCNGECEGGCWNSCTGFATKKHTSCEESCMSTCAGCTGSTTGGVEGYPTNPGTTIVNTHGTGGDQTTYKYHLDKTPR